MAHAHKLSLTTAVLVNLNIMIGVGIFINTIPIGKTAGILGSLSYLTIGILMLPLILSISALLALHPAGGFYTFGMRELSPFIGFIGTWSYFVGKLGSTAIMTHVSVLFLKELFPVLAGVNSFALDTLFLCLFALLNLQHLKTGGLLQTIFTILKLIPIFFLIVCGLFLWNPTIISSAPHDWSTIPGTLPLVLFSLLGFEAACSISSSIENAQKNASRAVLISYAIAISIYLIYQTVVYCVLGAELSRLTDYRMIFPAFLSKFMIPGTALYRATVGIFHCALASSALSAAYGIMFSNMWNLNIIAHHGHILGSSWFTRLNKHHVPWLCVITQVAIALLYLIITRGTQIPLQVTSALGSTVAYTMSACALLVATWNRPAIALHWAIPFLGLCSCLLLLSSCIYTLSIVGLHILYAYGVLILIGIANFIMTRHLPQFKRNECK